ncbi:acyl-CoA carboxylase subunit epsilon [Actinomadura sp. NPDC047616]|uniref:acyl-CoA carboxylase subunit epsilon n=1 Tax=Actinomadura sp. NPDC047616 TaxID=3155914 RepID=UPI0033F4EBA1
MTALKVVRGHPDEEELAAVVAVLFALAGRTAPGPPPRPEPAAWCQGRDAVTWTGRPQVAWRPQL